MVAAIVESGRRLRWAIGLNAKKAHCAWCRLLAFEQNHKIAGGIISNTFTQIISSEKESGSLTSSFIFYNKN